MLGNNLNRILTLVKKAGNIAGRTKFQKIVFILQCNGVNIPEKFRYHYYGPFSSDLQLEIEELVDRGILKEKKIAKSYMYEVDPDIDFNIDDDIEVKKELIDFLNKQDSQILELTSTIYFLNKEGLTDRNILAKKLISLKPHLERYIDESFKIQAEIPKLN